MRLLIIIAVIAALMFAGGWLVFYNSGEHSGVILDREKVKQDTQSAIEEGKELVEKAEDKFQNGSEDVKEDMKKDSEQNQP